MGKNNTGSMNGSGNNKEKNDISLDLTLGLGGHSTAPTSSSAADVVNNKINSPVVQENTSFDSVPLLQQPEQEQGSTSTSMATAAENNNNGGNRSENESGGNGRQRSRTTYANVDDIIPVPYPWATDRRSKIHDLKTLVSRNIHKISGEVHCKRCERRYVMEYDLREKSAELFRFIQLNMESMHQRAPRVWLSPVLPSCNFCNQENSVRPIISDNKESINWLFLLLGQMLGLCTLEQLKYFCKYANNHRTGAKDRVLYLTYLNLARQLYPDLIFLVALPS